MTNSKSVKHTEPYALPAGWKWTTLADVAKLNPPLDSLPKTDDEPVFFVPMANVGEDFTGIQQTGTRTYSQVKKGYTPFQVGDVIMAKITPCMENGKGGVIEGESGSIYYGSTEFHVIRPRNGIEQKWIGAFLSQTQIRRSARLAMKGSAGQLRVPLSFLENLLIPIPPTDEQIRITSRLDELLADLSAGVAALERVKRKLVRYRAAVLHAAVTGRLTEEWRKKHGPAKETGSELLERILTERRRQWEQYTLQQYKQKGKLPPKNWCKRYTFPDSQSISTNKTKLERLPDGWCWTALEQIACISSGTTPKRSMKSYWDNGSIPWVNSSVVNKPFVDVPSEYVTEFALSKTSLKLYASGTLLIALYGEGKTRGKITELRIAATTNQALAAISLNEGNDQMRSFVKIAIASMYQKLRAEASGGVQPNLTVDTISKTLIPLPPLEEQEAIAEIVSEKLLQITELESSINYEIIRGTHLRQSILKKAFEGNLVPQNLSDEPASVLLERISNEIERTIPKPARKRCKKMHGRVGVS